MGIPLGQIPQNVNLVHDSPFVFRSDDYRDENDSKKVQMGKSNFDDLLMGENL